MPISTPKAGDLFAANEAGLGPLRILYVEDDADLQQMLSEVLEDAGYAVSLASTAQEGVRQLGQRVFHLVISDYNLPDQNGARMLSRAAAEGLHCGESLILTGLTRLPEATAYRVMRKPVDVEHLLTAIRELLEPARAEAQRRAELPSAEKTPTELDGPIVRIAERPT